VEEGEGWRGHLGGCGDSPQKYCRWLGGLPEVNAYHRSPPGVIFNNFFDFLGPRVEKIYDFFGYYYTPEKLCNTRQVLLNTMGYPKSSMWSERRTEKYFSYNNFIFILN
jgi:hypothetical protein